MSEKLFNSNQQAVTYAAEQRAFGFRASVKRLGNGGLHGGSVRYLVTVTEKAPATPRQVRSYHDRAVDAIYDLVSTRTSQKTADKAEAFILKMADLIDHA